MPGLEVYYPKKLFNGYLILPKSLKDKAIIVKFNGRVMFFKKDWWGTSKKYDVITRSDGVKMGVAYFKWKGIFINKYE